MPTIHYLSPEHESLDVTLTPGESVLTCFLRNGIPINYGCKQGVCQACMLHAVKGTVSARSQQDLRDSLRAQNYFLACRCYPTEDLTVEVRSEAIRTSAQITALDWLTESIVRLRLAPQNSLPYHSGQFVNLTIPDGGTRSYSITSMSGDVELHIRVLSSGKMSEWLRSQAQIGSRLPLEGSFGDCFYVPENSTGGLLLAGNGTGAGPLWGIARDAIRHIHIGPIWFFHGVVDVSSLYLDHELRALAEAHANFHYVPVVWKGDAPASGYTGSLDQIMSDVMSNEAPSLSGWRAYLCGDPDLVMALRRRCFQAGIAIQDIHADEFTPAPK